MGLLFYIWIEPLINFNISWLIIYHSSDILVKLSIFSLTEYHFKKILVLSAWILGFWSSFRFLNLSRPPNLLNYLDNLANNRPVFKNDTPMIRFYFRKKIGLLISAVTKWCNSQVVHKTLEITRRSHAFISVNKLAKNRNYFIWNHWNSQWFRIL